MPGADLVQAIQQLIALLGPVLNPNLIIAKLLEDSLGTLLVMWSDFVLNTRDVASSNGGQFTGNATIKTFEPAMQAVANAALVLAVMWAGYRIMWGHGIRSQFTARVLLPRLLMGAILVNFAMPMFQAAVDASNVVSTAVFHFGSIPSDWGGWLRTLAIDPNTGLLPALTTGGLVLGYDVLALAYLVRYTVLVFLAILAPLAGLAFVVPDTSHLAKLWRKVFVTTLVMQPVQLFILSIGFALENAPQQLPVHHVFALASLLVLLKVPGAIGSAEKAAHKVESLLHTSFTHVEHALAKA